MRIDLPRITLRSLPVQLVEVQDGVLLKRGIVELHVGGQRAADVVQVILTAAASGDITREEICDSFAALDRPAVGHLLDQLLARRILAASSDQVAPDQERESALDVFFWNFGADAVVVAKRLAEKRVVVMGVNTISRQLASALGETGFNNVVVVDYPLLRNMRLYSGDDLDASQWNRATPLAYETWAAALEPDDVDCLVATSDFGGQHAMREWNELCVANGFRFLPVVLQDLTGWVGPLVVPGESACFECARGRQNAHLRDRTMERAAEPLAFEGQRTIGYHPSMGSILGDIAAMELTKFYSQELPMIQVGTLIEVSLMRPTIESHVVLKLPRCSVCSPLRSQSAVSPSKTPFMPGNSEGS